MKSGKDDSDQKDPDPFVKDKMQDENPDGNIKRKSRKGRMNRTGAKLWKKGKPIQI